MIIDQALMGRQYYTHDQKTTYTFRGLLISGTVLALGEYEDPTYKCSRITTHKLPDMKFLPAATPGTLTPSVP